MNKAFEKILERLEETNFNDIQMVVREALFKYGFPYESVVQDEVWDALDGLSINKFAKKIVQEVAEEFATDTNVGTNGWIPCSERLPEPNQKVIVSYMDRYIGGSYGVCEGQYVYILNSWDISDYMSNDDFEVIAWQPLPEPFKERD